MFLYIWFIFGFCNGKVYNPPLKFLILKCRGGRKSNELPSPNATKSVRLVTVIETPA